MIKKLKKLLFIVTCLLLLLISQGVSAVFAQGPANNSPVLDASGDPALDSIDEDVNVTGNAGTLVSVLIASVAPLDLITDADGDPEGLAIISVNDDEGEWEYSTDGGANWLTLNPSPDSARLLASDVMTTYIRFVPNPDFNGPVDFGITFRAWDQTSDSNGGTADTTTNGGETAFSVATETAGVTVNPVNDPPDAVDDTAATPTDTPRTVVVLGNDTDPDGDTLTVTTVGDPGNGTAALNLDDTVTYTPNLSFTGDDVFTYTIRDPASLTDTASVIVTVGVTNNSPVAVNDTATTFENTPLAVAVLNNDSDPDGDTLAVIAAGSPANGTASTNGASVTYIPNLNFSGSDAFTYTISDGDLTAAANVNVTVKSLGTNFWEEDRFDELVSGPLAGQNGWQLAAPYRSSPQVVPDGSGGKFLRIDARPGETIVVGKDIPDQTSGLHTFVVRARVLGDTDPAEPTLAKIEFRTDPSTGWTKKFQLYFGAHFRINYDPSGAAKIILPDNQLQTNRWYHIRGEMDLDHELLDVWLDNVLVAEDIPMHPGPLTDLGISGWDRGRTDFVEIDDLIGFQNDENMPAGACVWINSSGGLWTTASNWSTGAVPDASCHAFITLDGTYTVTLDTSRTVGSLTLGGGAGEQTLWIKGNSTLGNATLTVNNDLRNAGLMRMESINFGYASNLTISSGILTNTGVISVNQGTGGVRTISGNLVNQGTVNVNHDLTFNGEFTNTSTVDIAAGKKVSLSNGDVFNQNAGAITGQGVLELIGAATLNFNNGTIVDTLPLLRNANLNFGPSASGQASFILIGSNSTLSGSIGAEQTVWIRGDSTVGNATATAASGFTNAGLMRMESINFGYASNLTISSGILTNTGVISVNQGSGGVRAISGNLVNQGALEINLGSGQALTVSGANFDNAPGGVIQGSGTINVSGTTFGNAGEVRPGLPLGILNVTGNFPQTPSGALSIEIGGLIAASEFDQLKVSQQATLSGTLNLSLVNSFEPALGDSFQILTCKPCSGEFAIVTGQEIGNGKRLEVIYTPGTATIAGDVTLEVVPSTEVPITGLSASNDSPTVLGSATTLSATITGGSNVTYAWNFGDGATGTGQVVTHIYPATGIYTAVVTATNPISTATATTTISVIAANQAPNAVDDTATTLEDVTITISVLDNDTDPDGDTPTVTAADMPANGTASTDGTTVTYTPTLNFNGEDVFSYTVSDTGGLTDTATVTVTVAPVNDAPSFIKGSDQTVDEDAGPQTLANWATNISAGPADESGQSLTFSLTNDNNGLFAGQPALAADGTLTYELALNANGNALVTITLTDGGGTVNGGVDTSDPQSFTITVIPINDPPDAVDDTAETLEGTAVTIAVLDNDTDLENDPLTVTALGTPANGTASTNGATVVYTPTLNFNSTDVFSYTVSDGSLTDTATVTITVTPVNDAPDAVDDTAETLEDTPVTIAVLDNDTDLENDPLTVTALGPSANGTTSTDGTTVTYTPTLDFNGDDVFSYTISDGGLTDSAIVTVTVQPVPEGAILHFTPPTTTIPLGVTGLLTITVTPGTDPVNEVQIHGQVDPAHLRLLDVQPTGSLPQVLDPASFDPATGVFRYGAGLLGGVITEPFAALVLEVEAVATTTLTGTEVVFLSDFPPTDVSGPSGSVLAEAQNGVVIITPAATLQGTVDLQGRPAKPDPSWAIPLTVTLTPVGSSPVQTFPTTTDTSGVFTLTVITPGQYDVRVKGNHTLRNLAQSVDLVSGDNAYFLGTLLEGDVEVATTFNQVVLADFGLFSGSFNKCAGEAGFVANADLDESGCVALPDFGLLSGNFNKEGDIIVTATPSASLTSLRATDGQALLAFNADELTVVADEVVSLRVEVDPRGAQVNGAMVHLHFDPTLVEVVDVRLTNQLPFVLAEPWIDNQQGVVRFGAGMLGQTISERFSVASLSVKVKATTAGTSITPVVDIFPASDVSGPEGSVLAETKGITLKTEAGTGTEHTIFLPITIK
jgi:hypothetical protein